MVVSQRDEAAIEVVVVRFREVQRRVEGCVAPLGGHLRRAVGIVDSGACVGISGEESRSAEVDAVGIRWLSCCERVSQ